MKNGDSTKNSKLGAVGEELVKYHLLARGWDVINLNLIGNNKPNADLLAVKGKHVVRIQVKTSSYRDWVSLGFIQEGKSLVNSKAGEPATHFAMVGHKAPGDYSMHIIPAQRIKKWEQQSIRVHADGGRTKNGGYMYFGKKPRKSKYAINETGEEFEAYRDNWQSLEK